MGPILLNRRTNIGQVFFSIRSSGAVSYTHLDVYKRQVGESRGGCAIWAKLRTFPTKNTKKNVPKLQLIMAHCLLQ